MKMILIGNRNNRKICGITRNQSSSYQHFCQHDSDELIWAHSRRIDKNIDNSLGMVNTFSWMQ